jgi:hypothetical protein
MTANHWLISYSQATAVFQFPYQIYCPYVGSRSRCRFHPDFLGIGFSSLSAASSRSLATTPIRSRPKCQKYWLKKRAWTNRRIGREHWFHLLYGIWSIPFLQIQFLQILLFIGPLLFGDFHFIPILWKFNPIYSLNECPTFKAISIYLQKNS